MTIGPGSVTSRDPSERAHKSRTASRQHAITLVRLAALARLPRDRHFQQHVIMLVIALAAVAGLARQGKASLLARLVAWDKKRK